VPCINSGLSYMRKRVFLLAAVVCCCNITLAQTKQVDSLKNIIAGNAPDTAKIHACITLATSFDVKNFDSNLTYGRRGLNLAVKNKDSVSTGILLDGIGWAHYFSGRYDSATNYFYKSIGILERNKALKPLAIAYNDLAKLYRKTGSYERAINFYNKAAGIYIGLNDEEDLASIYNESGVVYEYQQKFDDALGLYKKSLELKTILHDSVGIAYALSFMAGVFNQQQKYKDAETYSLQALAIRQRIKDSFPIALSYSDLGDIYYAWGDNKKAKESYTASNTYVIGLHYPDYMASNLQQLSNIAEREKDYKAAFEYYKQSKALKDSMYRLESAKQVEELSAKYETVEKEQTIQEQKFQISKRNYYIAGISGLLVFGGLLGYSSYRRYRLKQQAKLHAEIVKQQDIATKAVLAAEETERKRIAAELHDGVGQMMSAARMNLSSIEDEINFTSPEQKHRFDKVVSLIDESCSEVRTVSHNMMPNALLKSGLSSAVRDFVDKIDTSIIKVILHAEGLNEHIDNNTEAVLYRVIQECVNNVIKHAGATRLDISLINDADGISVTIEDNGKGFDASFINKKKTLGLLGMKERTIMMGGTYVISSKPGEGAIVMISVPLQHTA